jgi:hypothetical protein
MDNSENRNTASLFRVVWAACPAVIAPINVRYNPASAEAPPRFEGGRGLPNTLQLQQSILQEYFNKQKGVDVHVCGVLSYAM